MSAIQQSDFLFLMSQLESKKLKLVKKPDGFIEGLAWNDLLYQMNCSIELLEAELKREGVPHLLQLRTRPDEYSSIPRFWRLYADGRQVASGTGLFAQECFIEDAFRFMRICRRAIEDAGLPQLSLANYDLLKHAERIAKVQHMEDDLF